MSTKFHVVAIFSTSYLARCAKSSLKEAYEAAKNDPLRRGHALVVRDGATGKRYSMHELERLTA